MEVVNKSLVRSIEFNWFILKYATEREKYEDEKRSSFMSLFSLFFLHSFVSFFILFFVDVKDIRMCCSFSFCDEIFETIKVKENSYSACYK